MNKTIITATDFSKKSYTKPEMKVIEIEQAELICQSPDPKSKGNSSMYEYDLGDGGFSD